MTALGGWFWPLAGKGLPVAVAAGATPARWAFEGMLLLESPAHPSPATRRRFRLLPPIVTWPKTSSPPKPNAWVPAADVTALVLMAIGWLARWRWHRPGRDNRSCLLFPGIKHSRMDILRKDRR